MKLIDFIPEEYWTIEGQFDKRQESIRCTLLWKMRKKKVKLSNEEEVEEVIEVNEG